MIRCDIVIGSGLLLPNPHQRPIRLARNQDQIKFERGINFESIPSKANSSAVMSVIVREGYIEQNLPDRYIKARVLENFIKDRIDEFGSEWAWRVSYGLTSPRMSLILPLRRA